MRRSAPFFLLCLSTAFLLGCRKETREIERPEKIVSWREVIYDSATYSKLAQLWENYYDAYPSEDAYANWMYAARYASLPNYREMLERGAGKYPANPVLLYLKGMAVRGGAKDAEARQLFERAVTLDPGYLDPWFGLVGQYMAQGDRENTDAALRKLLEGRAIEDAVMDYSYNMLVSLGKDAILVTNGDNDTYPGWILTRLLKIRPDVHIVNRALLNADWYPFWIMKEGVPTFITQGQLDSLTHQFAAEVQRGSASGPFGDNLLVKIIDAAERANRPVYFSVTLEKAPVVMRYTKQAWNLGLVRLVNPGAQQYRVMLRNLFAAWIRDYRTGGLDSWQVRYSPRARASKYLVINYGEALASLMDQLASTAPESRLPLFRWYRAHLEKVIPQDAVEKMNRSWCRADAPEEIRSWCKNLGYQE